MNRNMSQIATERAGKYIEQKRKLARKQTDRNLVKLASKKSINTIQRIRQLKKD